MKHCDRCGKKLGANDWDIHTCTPKQMADEPVACQHKRYSVDVREQIGTCYDCGAEGRMKFVVNETPQPQREWVGLTDEEVAEIVKEHRWHPDNMKHLMPVFRSLEAKLREKNGGNT